MVKDPLPFEADAAKPLPSILNPNEIQEKPTTTTTTIIPVITSSFEKKSPPSREIPHWYKLANLYSYVIIGGFDTLVAKYQNTTVVNGVTFNHPFIQVIRQWRKVVSHLLMIIIPD